MAASELDQKKFWKAIYEQERVASRMVDLAARQEDGSNFELSPYGTVKLMVKAASSIGENYLSDAYYNTATLNGGVSYKAFVKVLPSNPLLRATALSLGVYSREIATYCHLFPFLRELCEEKGLDAAEIPLKVPEIYHTNLDTTVAGESAESATVLVMEELNFQGFRMVDKRYGCSRDGAREVLSALGNFHALGYVWMRKYKNADGSYSLPQSVEYLFNPLDIKDMFVAVGGKMLMDLQELMERLGRPELADWLAEQMKFLEHEYSLKDVAECGPLACICHSDCWSNNFLFHFDGDNSVDDVRIVDWQTLLVENPGKDFYHFFLTSLTPELRKECGQELLEHYITTFLSGVKKLGVCLEDEGLDRHLVTREINKRMRFGLFTGLVITPSFMDKTVTSKFEEMDQLDIEVSQENLTKAFGEAQDALTVDMMLTNEPLCQRIIAIAEELKQILN